MDVDRARSNACPRCATTLVGRDDGKYDCERCRGVWVEDEHLRAMIETMAPDLDPDAPLLYAVRATAGPLPCPFCTEPVQPTRFAGVPIDRCTREQHLGVWLDAGELEHVLRVTGLRYADRRATIDPPYERPDAGPWVPEPEPDRMTAWDMLRALVGRPRKPEP